MATEILKGPLGEIRAASAAGGGTALTTTAVRIPLPFGTKFIQLMGQGYVTDVVAQFLKNPWLTILKTTDALVTEANMTNGSEALQDGAAGTSLSTGGFSTAANGNFIYFGAKLPFAGLDVTVGTVNAIASVMTVKYWNGTAWTTTAATDGTASVGVTLAVNGLVTWTMPADWKMAPLRAATGGNEVGTNDTTLRLGIAAEPYYWVRLEVSVQLTNPSTITGVFAINRSTAYAELLSGLPAWEERVTVGEGQNGISCIQAKMPANTGKLIVNCFSGADGRFQ